MEVVKKDEKKETSWYEIGSLLFKIIYTVLYNGCFLWLGVNLFLVAFAIPFHLTILQAVGFWGSGILLVIGILETHNYTFGQTVKNIFLTIVFMILFLIICMVVVIMFDQIRTLIETIWKEVKLRAGWY
jgi:hypothetical protein